MKTEIKSLAKIIWFFTKIFAVLVVAQAAIWYWATI